MKTFASTLMGILFALCDLHGQGTIYFANRARFTNPPINAPIYDVDGSLLEGEEALAQLYVAAPVTDSLRPVSDPPVHFLTGIDAGFIPADDRDVFAAPDTPALAQIRAWKGAPSWEEATIRGESNIIPLILGGGGGVPMPPGYLVGLQSFSLIPEPSSVGLFLLGMAVLFGVRSRFIE